MEGPKGKGIIRLRGLLFKEGHYLEGLILKNLGGIISHGTGGILGLPLGLG